MNIGIITQPLACNYGGILQNYALQQALIKLGHIPYTFDIGRFTWSDWSKIVIKTLIKKMLGRKCDFPSTPDHKKAKEAPLRSFALKRISLMKPRVMRITNSLVDKYAIDAIVVGSDQVWRPMYNYDITDMFLAFLKRENVKRIAYAASFGTNEWEFTIEQTDTCKKLAAKFNAISVREDAGVDICKKYLNVDAMHVLDPTLLLRKEDYNLLLANVSVNQKRTLFAYLLDITDDKVNFVKEIASQLGLSPIIKSAGARLSNDDSIELWLSNFKEAKYVITDSFHGAVFSIIYNVNFNVIGNYKRGLSRMNSLLNLFDLSNRFIDESNLKACYDNLYIDWKSVNERLERMRELSITFLRKSLKN